MSSGSVVFEGIGGEAAVLLLGEAGVVEYWLLVDWCSHVVVTTAVGGLLMLDEVVAAATVKSSSEVAGSKDVSCCMIMDCWEAASYCMRRAFCCIN